MPDDGSLVAVAVPAVDGCASEQVVAGMLPSMDAGPRVPPCGSSSGRDRRERSVPWIAAAMSTRSCLEHPESEDWLSVEKLRGEINRHCRCLRRHRQSRQAATAHSLCTECSAPSFRLGCPASASIRNSRTIWHCRHNRHSSQAFDPPQPGQPAGTVSSTASAKSGELPQASQFDREHARDSFSPQ